MTVSKAYSLLEREGLLERRRGVGLFVAAVPRQQMKREKKTVLEELLRRAAVAAVQLDVSRQETLAMFRKILEDHARGDEGRES
jgi:GntR family transcriptional regulator